MSHTTASDAHATPAVPQPIVETLQRLIHRIRLVILLRGVLAVTAVLLSATLAIMAIDAGLTLFSSGPRWMLTLSAWAVTAAAAGWFILRPLAKTFTLAGAARMIEARHPEMQERVSSAIQLLTSRDRPELLGSAALIHALAEQATDNVRLVVPRREVSLAALRPVVILAGLAAVALAGVLALWPSRAGRLLARAWAPYANLANIYADDFRITPGDRILPAGEPLRVEVTLGNRAVRSAELLIDGLADRQASLPMTRISRPDGPPRFAGTCPPAASSYRYRIHAGDGWSRYYTVRVVTPPAVEELSARLAYPRYVGWADETIAPLAGPLGAIEGTRVSILCRANKAVRRARMRVGGSHRWTLTGRRDGDDPPGLYRFDLTLPPGLQGTWRVALTDTHGFETVTEPARLQSVADAPPVARIVHPGQSELDLRPDDRLPIAYVGADDVALTAVELIVEPEGRPRRTLSLLEADAAPGPVTGTTTLDLAELAPRGKRIRFRLRCLDNYPADLGRRPGPQEGLSPWRTIRLDDKTQPYIRQVLQAEELAIRQALESILTHVRAARSHSDPLRRALGRQPRLTDRLVERVDKIRDRLGQADAAIARLERTVTGSAFAGLGNPLANLSAGHVGRARSYAGQMKLLDEPDSRGPLAEKIDFHVYRSQEIVEGMLEQLGLASEMLETAHEADELTAEQRRLLDELVQQQLAEQLAEPDGTVAGLPTEETSPADGSWKQDQQQVAGELAEMLARMPEARKVELQRQAEAARSLAEQARQLAGDQETLSKDTAETGEIETVNEKLFELAERQKRLAEQAGDAPAGEMMARAADAVEAGRVREALDSQQQAADRIGQQDSDLARRQRELGKETRSLLERRDALAGAQRRRQMERLQGEQEQLAEQVEAVAEEVGRSAPQADDLPMASAKAARRSADQLKAGQAASASASAAASAERLSRLADRVKRASMGLTPEPPAGGERPAEMAGSEEPELPGESAGDPQQPGAPSPSASPSGAQQESDSPGDGSASSAQAGSEAASTPGADEAGTTGQGSPPEGGQRSQGSASARSADDGAPAGQQASGQSSSGQASSGPPSGNPPSPAGAAPAAGRESSQLAARDATDPPRRQLASMDEQAAEQARLAEQVRELADRQDALAEQIGRLAQQEGLALMEARQRQLTERTGELAGAVGLMSEHQDDLALPDKAARRLAQADGELAPALEGQQAAERALEAGQAPAAADRQAASSQHLARAAEALGQMGSELARPAGPAAPGDQPLAEALSKAFEAAAQASSAEVSSAARAAASLAALRAEALAAAQALGGAPSNLPGMGQGQGQGQGQGPAMAPGRGAISSDPSVGVGLMRNDPRAVQLESLGVSVSDWARLPGELRSEILQAAETSTPSEYRAYVRRYFRILSRRGARLDAMPSQKDGE